MAGSSRTAPDAFAAQQEIDLPPGFTLIALRELGDAFAHAMEIAPRHGAGTLVWVRRFDLVEFAVVLEPEEPLATARLAHYAGMNALADMLSFHAPPEREIAFDWPDGLLLDGGLLGGGRLGWPAGTAEDAVPEFLVFGAMLRFSAMTPDAAGLHSRGVALDDEGLAEVAFPELIGSFCRHFMTAVNDWTDLGPRAVVEHWLERLPAVPEASQGIGPEGDLLRHRGGTTERQSLSEALAAPAWLDPERGEPWL